MKISRIALGAGSKNFKEQPNVLRLFIGEEIQGDKIHLPHVHKGESIASVKKDDEGGFIAQNISVIETNIDDMNPQIYEYVFECLFEAGALDVFLTNIIMKKSRPGIKLTVLCPEGKEEDIFSVIFEETTSIGVRFYRVFRRVLPRTSKEVGTEFGRLKMKITTHRKNKKRYIPEYEDCKELAKRNKVPLLEILDTVHKKKVSKGT
jgi:hypothetical protein